MRSFDSLIQLLLTIAILGLGVLLGLALAIPLHGADIGGVAPLFANAIGAAIGAGITLWVAERRNHVAVSRELRAKLIRVTAQLATIHVHASAIQTGLRSGEIDALAANAVRALEESFLQSHDIFGVLLEVELAEDFSGLTINFTNIQRILSELPKDRSQLRRHLIENASECISDFEFLDQTVQKAQANAVRASHMRRLR